MSCDNLVANERYLLNPNSYVQTVLSSSFFFPVPYCPRFRILSRTEHIDMKRKQLDHKTREIKWLIGKNSPLSLENKLLVYKTVLKPVWTYGIELWDCANKSNIAIVQRYQSKLLRTITNAPWYVTNHTLHTDLHIPYIHTVIHDRINKHRTTLASHPNPLMEPLLQPTHNRRLQRRWTFDWTD